MQRQQPYQHAYPGDIRDVADVQMPPDDVRRWLDERAIRGWTRSSRRILRIVLLLASDTAAGLAGVYTAMATWWLVSSGGARPLPNDIPLAAMVLCLQPLALLSTGAYRGGRASARFWRIAVGIGIAALLGWIHARLYPFHPSPDKVAYVYSSLAILAYAWAARLGIQRLIAASYRHGALQRRVLVVGSQQEVLEVQRRWAIQNPEMCVVGRVSADSYDLPRLGVEQPPLFGTLRSLREALSDARAHCIVIATNLAPDRLESLIAECFSLGASVSVQAPAPKGQVAARVEVSQNRTNSILHVHPLHLELPQLLVKRTLDVMLTLSVTTMVAPALVLIALAIKLDSPGPILFRQVRMGLGGRRFQILKFRTMVADADQRKALVQHLNEYPDARLFKIRHDPRTTRVGRVLRKTSLDELPQLWNVLRGDMSLVGPRPCVPEEFAQYAPHHMERLWVVPGVTGPWQVSGRNAIQDFEEVVRLDREYIRSWSLWRDVLILVKTVPALYGKGVY